MNLDTGGLSILLGPVIRPGTIDLAPSTGINLINLPVVDTRVTALGWGLRYGVKRDIELGLRLPSIVFGEGQNVLGNSLTLSSTFQKRNPSGEVGARLSLVVPIRKEANLGFALETPLVLHSSDVVLFDLVPGVFLTLADEVQAGWVVPARLAINVTDEFFFGAKIGFGGARFKDAPVSMPVGGFAGYTVHSGNFLMDITLGLDWPSLVVFQDGESARLPDFYVLGFGVNIQLN